MALKRRLLWIRLAVAFGLEFAFLAFALPWCVKDGTYRLEVWKDFGVACGAVLGIYMIWPAFRGGGTWLRVCAVAACALPAWVLGWVILQHFELVPRWFS